MQVAVLSLSLSLSLSLRRSIHNGGCLRLYWFQSIILCLELNMLTAALLLPFTEDIRDREMKDF